MPFAKLRRYREALRGIPPAQGGEPRASLYLYEAFAMKCEAIESRAKRSAQRRSKVT
jgi:hypothetical protein